MPEVNFHDGRLVEWELDSKQSLRLDIGLDPVWNDGSDRIVSLRLVGISNLGEVRDWFLTLDRVMGFWRLFDQGLVAKGTEEPPEREPTVLYLEFFRDESGSLAALDLVYFGQIEILCRAIECAEASALPCVE
jgi:hypothetical protein